MSKKSGTDETASTRQITRGALLSYLGIGFQVVAGLIYTPWMIRQLGQSDYALFALMTSITGALMIDLGLRHVVPRFVAKYRAEDDALAVNEVVGAVILLYVAIDLAVLTLLVLIYLNLPTLYRGLTAAEIERLRVIFVIAGTYSVLSFPFATLNGILAGHERFVQLKVCDLLQKVAAVSLGVAGLLRGYGLIAVVAANAVAGLLATGARLVIVARSLPVIPRFRYSGAGISKALLAFALWTGVGNIASEWIFNTTPSILARVSGSQSVAIFGVASALEGYVFLLANPISELFLPRVTRMVLREDAPESLLQLMVRVGRIQLVVVGFLTVAFLAVGRHFLSVWLGTEYAAAYASAAIMMLPALVFVPQLIATQVVLAMDKVKLQAIVYLGVAVTSVGLSLVFAPIWGALGAALAVFVSYVLRDVGLNLIYLRSAGIDIAVFFRKCHGSLALPLLGSLLAAVTIDALLPPSGVGPLAVKCGLISLAHFGILWVAGANPSEKALVARGLSHLLRVGHHR